MSAAVGAFLVGIALTGPVAEAARKLLAPCEICSLPSSSCSSDCRRIRTACPRLLLVAAVLAVVSAVGKAGYRVVGGRAARASACRGGFVPGRR